MNLAEIIKIRRSHRKFDARPVEEEKVTQLLHAALMAPSGKRAMPWEFVVITDQETSQALSKCKPNGAAFVALAPLNIVVLANTEKSDVWVEDCSIAASYLQLKAEELGLGSCWAQVRRRTSCDENVTATEYIRCLLNIPAQYEVECIISIGYKAEERPAFDESRVKMEKVHFGTF